MIKAVKKAKNDWLQEKVSEVEVAMWPGHAHRSMWKSLRDLKRGRVGLRPVMARSIKKANGDLCESVEESVNCWQEHFCQILNIQSRFSEDALSFVQPVAVS